MAAILIVAGCVLAPVSVLAVWAASEVTSTGRYVATMEPLVHDPAIQNALTGKITAEITARLNVTGYAGQAGAALADRGLPRVSGLLKSVAPSIASGVAGSIHGEVRKIALVFVFWGQPTAAVAIVIAVLLLVALGLIELIGRPPPAQPEAAGHP